MAGYLLPHQPSIGQATNTKVDSSAKHIQQCRISTDDMLRYCNDDVDELDRQKFRYCVHKDEFAVGIGRPWHPLSAIKRASNGAYPRVVSNLGMLGDNNTVALDMIRFVNHYARTITEKKAIVDWFSRDIHNGPFYANHAGVQNLPGTELFKPVADPDNPGVVRLGTKKNLGILCDFLPVGFSNTLGYAHPLSGDTMCSVMIGGTRTVQNGHFEIFPGDLVQFYWPFEKDDFYPDGRRKPFINIFGPGGQIGNVDPSVDFVADPGRPQHWNLPHDAVERGAFYDRQYASKQGTVKLVALIKPYFRDDENPRHADPLRVIGKAISGARPHEMVDIKIGQQSM